MAKPKTCKRCDKQYIARGMTKYNNNWLEYMNDTYGKPKRPKTCKRCSKQYIGQHKCEVVITEQERVKQSGRW